MKSRRFVCWNCSQLKDNDKCWCASCHKIDQIMEFDSVRPFNPRLQSSWSRGVVMSTNIHKNCICILCIQMQIQKYKNETPHPKVAIGRGWGCHPMYTKSAHIDLIESYWRRCMDPECNWKQTISFKALSCPGETILFWGGRLSSNTHKINL